MTFSSLHYVALKIEKASGVQIGENVLDTRSLSGAVQKPVSRVRLMPLILEPILVGTTGYNKYLKNYSKSRDWFFNA